MAQDVGQEVHSRRKFMQFATLIATTSALSGTVFAASASQAVVAYRNPGCGCCEKWAEQMKASGFDITMQDDAELAARKAKLGIPDQLAGCHTAVIGPYVIEGHVPPADIIRFLSEKHDALGLAVPGMPIGSPGMEMGDSKEPFDVVMFKADGSSVTYVKHS